VKRFKAFLPPTTGVENLMLIVMEAIKGVEWSLGHPTLKIKAKSASTQVLSRSILKWGCVLGSPWVAAWRNFQKFWTDISFYSA